MNHEIHHHSKFITTIGWVLILLFVYLFIVLLNFALSRIERYTPIITKAQQIENLRYKQEDIPQIKTAKYNGYMRLMLPNILDDISAKPIVNGLINKTNIGLIGGQPHTKVFFCNEGYGLIKYKTDRFGLRNNDILWDKLDTLDILIIGDSFAQGACVNDISTISGFLLAKGHLAINTGTASNGPQNYAFLSKVFIKAVKPKYVVNILYTNDSYSEKIKENIPVTMEEMELDKAKAAKAQGVFDSKYGEKVKVYSIGDFSKEICAGPHVENTSELGHFKIKKEQSSSSGVRRIKAVLE